MSEGDDTHDRTCADCTPGSYSTTPNATLCSSWRGCSAGQYVAVPPSPTNDRGCEPCEGGSFSASSNTPECTVWRDCPAGTFATTPNLTTDRVCTACSSGTFAANLNSASCTAYAVCAAGQVETAGPSATQNRVCAPLASVVTWTRQFGTALEDRTNGVASAGTDVVVVGSTFGILPGQATAGLEDAFVRKYDASGNILWTHQFGTSSNDSGVRVVIDGAGDIIVAGTAGDALPSQAWEGDGDAFLRKYDADGNVLWTRQFGTAMADWVGGVTVDADDNIIVVGDTLGAFPSFTRVGAYDIFVAKYDPSGARLWLHQFGSEALAAALSRGVAADSSGNVFLVGSTYAGAFPGQTALGNDDAFVFKLDANGDVLWIRQFGASEDDQADAVAINAVGEIIIAGSTRSVLAGQVSSGGFDVFLEAYDSDGAHLWTRQHGTSGSDASTALAIASDGEIYVAGRVYESALDGHSASGEYDAFVTRYSATGVLLGGRQFGSPQSDYALGLAFLGSDLLISGMTDGALPAQTSSGQLDAYLIRMPTW